MDSSVALATAYLELNGFFVLTELPVQIADRRGYRTATDVDILAVRLPHAAELVLGSGAHARDLLLGQDPALDIDASRTEVLIAEVKRGRGQLNDASRDMAVLRFALRRTGCCAMEMLDAHAATLARAGMVETTTVGGHPCRIRVASFAGVAGPLGRGVLSLQLRGAYFRDPVPDLLGLVDQLSAVPQVMVEKESVHAS